MIDDRELGILLSDLESDRVERKTSVADSEKIRKTICAFANDLPDHQQPGVIFIGVDEKGGCANLTVTDRLLRTLADMRSDGNIMPFPSLTVQKKKIAGCDLAIVTVEPSDAPPVRYKGRVWVRVGPSTRIASAEEERRLTEKRRARDLPFDIRPMPSAKLTDLDIDLFERVYLPASLPPETLEQNQRGAREQMMSMRFATVEPDPRPTVLGILVVGKDPRDFLPGVYIQFLRIDGTELTDPIKAQKEISGPLPHLLQALDETFQAHISVAAEITVKPVELRHPDYPLVALRQLARNAVLHRTYEGTNAPVRITWFSDRIEIQNPGGPFGQVNRQNFGKPGVTDYRNPHLAEAMKNLGYVQRFGMGIPLARKELKKNGNPPPEFVAEDDHVLVAIRVRS